MNRIKRIAIAVGIVLAMATAASAAYSVLAFDGYTDYTVASAQDTPCGYGMQGAAQPVTYDKSLWLVFTCLDGSVVARRLHVAVIVEPESVPPIVPTYRGLPHPPVTSACEQNYPGFVDSIQGGCVPPDHPLARR